MQTDNDFFVVVIYLICSIVSICMIFRFFELVRLVRCIEKKQTPGLRNDFYFLICNGFLDEAHKALLEVIWQSREMNCMRTARSKQEFDRYHHLLKSRYESFFQQINVAFPDYEIIRNPLPDA